MQVYDVAFTTQGWLRPWMAPWYRWDTAWFILIAHSGYGIAPETVAFAPLYPLLIRGLAPLVAMDYLAAALIISNLACIAALTALHLLIHLDFSQRTADLSVVLLIGFPAAFFLVAGYAESLFLAFAIGAWLAVRNERYVLAGILGLLASLSRSQGWVLGLVFGLVLLLKHWRLEEKRLFLPRIIPGLPAIAGPFLGELVYLVSMDVLGYGNVAAIFQGAYWNVRIQAPWVTIIEVFVKLIQGQFQLFDWINVLGFLFGIVVAGAAYRRLKPEYLFFILISIGFALLRGTPSFVLNGFLRYTIGFFPIFIGLAILMGSETHPNKAWIWLYLFTGLFLQILFVMFFASWIWVS